MKEQPKDNNYSIHTLSSPRASRTEHRVVTTELYKLTSVVVTTSPPRQTRHRVVRTVLIWKRQTHTLVPIQCQQDN